MKDRCSNYIFYNQDSDVARFPDDYGIIISEKLNIRKNNIHRTTIIKDKTVEGVDI